jgi:hypothetical protein
MFEIGVRWNDQSAVTANALPKLYTFGSTRTLEPNPDSKIHVRINLFTHRFKFFIVLNLNVLQSSQLAVNPA